MKSILLSFAASAAISGIAAAQSIGINFLHTNDTSFAAANAGAPGFEQENWNHMQADWSGVAANDALFSAGLLDSAGNAAVLLAISYGAESDAVHFDSANTWYSSSGGADANATLMNGYLDDGGNDQPYVNVSLASGQYSVYSVVVYVNGDVVNGAVGRYWLEEWTDPLAEGAVITDRVGISSNSYAGTFVQAGSGFVQTATPTNVNVASGNFIVFENITARNLRVRSSGNGDPEDFGRGPLNAIQIIDTTVDDDGDGLPNAWEIANMLDPNEDGTDGESVQGAKDGVNGALGDPDADGLTNFEEYDLYKTNPRSVDTDGDMLEDGDEVVGAGMRPKTNPTLADTDFDGLSDLVEDNTDIFASDTQTGSDPTVVDSDGDTLRDKWEVDNMFDPNDNGDTDEDNGAMGDPDSDASFNSEEQTRGTDPRDPDSDDDMILDGYETNDRMFVSAMQTGTDPLDADTDNDTIRDDAETGGLDSTDPNLADTDGDFLRDDWEIANGRDPRDGVKLSVVNGGIGLNFGAGRGNASLLSTASAGVAAQSNWNNLAGAAGGPTALVDHDGNASTAAVTWATDEEWSVAGPGADANGALLTGWISANNTNGTNTIDITGIPYASYDLIVYFNHDRVTEDVEISETNNAFSPVLLQESDPNIGVATPFYQQVASAAGDGTRTGTFYLIEGVSAANLNLVLNAGGAAGTADRGAITGIQIVAKVPESDFRITDIVRVPDGNGGFNVTITWASKQGVQYGIDAGETLADFQEISDKISEGALTSFTQLGVPASSVVRFYRIREL